MFRSFPLTNYVPGRVSYSRHYCHSNFLNILTTDFEFSPEELKAYRDLINFSPMSLLMTIFEIENKPIRHQYYLKFMAGYRWKNPFWKFVFRMFYYPLHLTNATNKDISRYKQLIKKLMLK